MCTVRGLYKPFLASLLLAIIVLSVRGDEKKLIQREQPKPLSLVQLRMAEYGFPILTVFDAIRHQRQISDALTQWQTASEVVVPPSDEEEHVAYALNKTKYTGHEISVALEFRKPVRVDELNKRYRWKRIETTDKGVVLTAEPREAVDRMFYRRFDLLLSPKTHLPVSLNFTGRDGLRKNEPLRLAVEERVIGSQDKLKLISAETPAIIFKAEPRRIVEPPSQLDADPSVPVEVPRP